MKPFALAKVRGVHGEDVSEVVLVNVMLRSRAGFAELRVIKAVLAPDADMLIGMDIISLGDLAITNFARRTMFSFRSPSLGHIDLATEFGKESD